jgi:hypothetical protein
MTHTYLPQQPSGPPLVYGHISMPPPPPPPQQLLQQRAPLQAAAAAAMGSSAVPGATAQSCPVHRVPLATRQAGPQSSKPGQWFMTCPLAAARGEPQTCKTFVWLEGAPLLGQLPMIPGAAVAAVPGFGYGAFPGYSGAPAAAAAFSFGDSRGGGDSTCFNCGQAGHFSKDCTNARGGGGYGIRAAQPKSIDPPPHSSGSTRRGDAKAARGGREKGRGGGRSKSPKSWNGAAPTADFSYDGPVYGDEAKGGGGGFGDEVISGAAGKATKRVRSAGDGSGGEGRKCSLCRQAGHNKSNCPLNMERK